MDDNIHLCILYEIIQSKNFISSFLLLVSIEYLCFFFRQTLSLDKKYFLEIESIVPGEGTLLKLILS